MPLSHRSPRRRRSNDRNGHSVSCLRGSSIHCDEMPVNTLRVGTHRERDWGSPIGMIRRTPHLRTRARDSTAAWVRTSVTIVVNARHEKDRPLRSARNQLLKIAPPSECARASPLRRVPSDGTILVKSGWSCSAVVPSQSFEADGCVYRSSVIRSDTCCEFVFAVRPPQPSKSGTIIGFLLSLQFKRFVQCCSIPAGKNHGN
jgi:hypothetical protein